MDIDTGRKNQIRAHLSELGCPRGGRPGLRRGRQPAGPPVPPAHELALTDPFTGEGGRSAPGPQGFRALVC